MTTQTLAQVVKHVGVDVAPARLPSLLPLVQQELSNIERQGISTTVLASLFNEMDERETRARANAAIDRKELNHALDQNAVLDERISHLNAIINSLRLDKVELAAQLDLAMDTARDEIVGAYQDGQQIAITGLAERLGHLLNLDADALESMFIRAIDGNIPDALEVMNTLLDAMERNVA